MDKKHLSAQIGQRLRYYRLQRQFSLDELAGATGVSKPMLGQIERGNSNPTVSVLWKIAAGLQIPFASFLVNNPSIKIKRAGDQPDFREDDDKFETYNTFASPGIPLETYRIRLLPGCIHHSTPGGMGVLKLLTVHSGTLTIKIGSEEENELYTGDSISFSNDVFQVYQNTADDVCEISMSLFYSSHQI
ncbi:XRE family transcriptional regulator [Mesobacillus foraminis]|uniref:Helix-turn-helix protein n=1 Tax=Mesobacillus foraminis TaxID=279826 RepID=A0A4R2BEC8_9BACI|nr:XRE family transcriptional regulator [Mesobacillus foraminis]TCN24833.1 helix-turn-helix protein [Mesobacillus foraminis]